MKPIQRCQAFQMVDAKIKPLRPCVFKTGSNALGNCRPLIRRWVSPKSVPKPAHASSSPIDIGVESALLNQLGWRKAVSRELLRGRTNGEAIARNLPKGPSPDSQAASPRRSILGIMKLKCCAAGCRHEIETDSDAPSTGRWVCPKCGGQNFVGKQPAVKVKPLGTNGADEPKTNTPGQTTVAPVVFGDKRK